MMLLFDDALELERRKSLLETSKSEVGFLSDFLAIS